MANACAVLQKAVPFMESCKVEVRSSDDGRCCKSGAPLLKVRAQRGTIRDADKVYPQAADSQRHLTCTAVGLAQVALCVSVSVHPDQCSRQSLPHATRLDARSLPQATRPQASTSQADACHSVLVPGRALLGYSHVSYLVPHITPWYHHWQCNARAMQHQSPPVRATLQGSLQFVVTDGEATACLSPEAAGQLLTPLVKAGRFSISNLAGLPALGLNGRQQLFRAFASSAALVAKFNKQHPVAEDDSSAGQACDGSSPQDVAAKDQQQYQQGAAAGKGRGSKRKEPGSASTDDAPAAGRPKRVRGSTGQAAQQQQAQQEDPPSAEETDPAAAAEDEEDEEDDGLTEYERQRNEQIKRNQARLAALELPQMVAAMAAQVAKKPAASKGISTRRTKPAEPGELRRWIGWHWWW